MVDTVARCGARICLLRFRTSMSRTEKRPRMVACARHCAPMCSVAIRSCPWARRGADRGPSRRVAPPDMRRRTPRGDWMEPAAADEASARWESRSLRERFRHSELYHGVSLTVHGSSVRVIESPCVLVACRVLSFRPARTAVQKADLITRFGPSLHSPRRGRHDPRTPRVWVCVCRTLTGGASSRSLAPVRFDTRAVASRGVALAGPVSTRAGGGAGGVAQQPAIGSKGARIFIAIVCILALTLLHVDMLLYSRVRESWGVPV